MPTAETQTDMTPQQAILFEQVYLPEFLKQAAARGRQFPQEELPDVLKMAEHLVRLDQTRSTGSVKAASQALDRLVGADVAKQEAAVSADLADVAAGYADSIPGLRQAALAG